MISQINFSYSDKEVKNLINDILQGYNSYLKKHHPEANFDNISNKLMEYMKSKEAQEIIRKEIENIIKQNGKILITQDQLQEIMNKVLKSFEDYAKKNKIPDGENLQKYLEEYMQSEELKEIISNDITKVIQSQNIDKQITNIMNNYVKSAMTEVSNSLQKEITKGIGTLSVSQWQRQLVLTKHLL